MNKKMLEKAGKSELTECLLKKLVEKSTEEIKEACGLLYYENNKKNSDIMARIIAHDNIKSFRANQPTYEIVVKLADVMPMSDGCSVLYVLDELEKLDEASKYANMLNGDWKLYIIFSHMWKDSFWMIEDRWKEWKILIENLYPWLHVEFSF